MIALEPSEIAERARRIGLTQVELARRAGVSVNTVGRFLSPDGPNVWVETHSSIERALIEAEREFRGTLTNVIRKAIEIGGQEPQALADALIKVELLEQLRSLNREAAA